MKLCKNKQWLYQKYWIENLSSSQIGKICNVCHQTVLNQMSGLGIKRRSLNEAQLVDKNKNELFSINMSYQNRRWLINKYKKGKLSQYKIAEMCNVDPMAISNHMKKFNIKVRSFKELNGGKNNARYGVCLSEETKRRIGEKAKQRLRNKENCSFYGKHHSQKTKKTLSQKIKNLHQETDIYSNPEYIKRNLRAIAKRPTSPERLFDDMTPKIIRYVGNRAWWRKLPNGKNSNPDFKVTGQNKVIFVHGNYWHKGEDKRELINLYEQIGFDCLVIWENEIYKQPELVKEEVNNFIHDGAI